MKLLITGAIPWCNSELDSIAALGHDIVYMPDERSSLQDVDINPVGIEGIICNGLFLYHDIGQFSDLRMIQLTSAGFNRVPIEYIKAHEIDLFTARDVYSIPMSEFAIGGVLQLYKNSRFFFENQMSHKWEKDRGLLELYGKNVLIIGCGSVGRECAARFRAFGCHVNGIGLTKRDIPEFDNVFSVDMLDRMLPEAYIVLLALPLSDETRHIINEKVFLSMNPAAIIVNISRGGVIDTSALIEALINKAIGGAVLDVFEEEPLSKDSPLWDMDNVIITPHNSFVSDATKTRLLSVIHRNFRRH